jgi:hypothetical protein
MPLELRRSGQRRGAFGARAATRTEAWRRAGAFFATALVAAARFAGALFATALVAAARFAGALFATALVAAARFAGAFFATALVATALVAAARFAGALFATALVAAARFAGAFFAELRATRAEAPVSFGAPNGAFPFSISLNNELAPKLTPLLAEIRTAAPVWGLRPMRAARRVGRKAPNPTIATRRPPFTSLTMVCTVAFTTFSTSRLAIPVVFTTDSTSSDLFTATS